MIYFFYERVKKFKYNNKPYWSLMYKWYKLLLNTMYPISEWFNNSYGLSDESKVIVSLTTYPGRVKIVWITIASLLNQTMKPYKVVLWLAEDQFPNKQLPLSLRRMQRRGLEIRYCDDLKPHKKYYYTMLEYPDHYIVTADDDIFYPENHLEVLWKGHMEYSKCVVCTWSHRISFDEEGRFAKYNEWENSEKEAPSHLTLAVGCNGVLYPPYSLHEKAFDKQVIRERALFTDDLWLKCMEILKNTKVVNCSDRSLIYFSILRAQRDGLWKQNADHEKKNDRIWKELMEYFPEVKECLKKDRSNEKEG